MTLIREYLDTDRDALRALVLALHETVRPWDADLAPGEEIIEAYLAHLLSRRLETAGALFVAEARGALVGYACVFGRVLPRDPDERPIPYAYLADLYVAPVARQEGLGAKLISQVEAHARSVGAAKLELTVVAPNEVARRFYAAQGFSSRSVIMTKRL